MLSRDLLPAKGDQLVRGRKVVGSYPPGDGPVFGTESFFIRGDLKAGLQVTKQEDELMHETKKKKATLQRLTEHRW